MFTQVPKKKSTVNVCLATSYTFCTILHVLICTSDGQLVIKENPECTFFSSFIIQCNLTWCHIWTLITPFVTLIALYTMKQYLSMRTMQVLICTHYWELNMFFFERWNLHKKLLTNAELYKGKLKNYTVSPQKETLETVEWFLCGN